FLFIYCKTNPQSCLHSSSIYSSLHFPSLHSFPTRRSSDLRQSTLGASSWLLGNRDGTQRRQHSWKVSARHHASEEGDRENRQEAQADQRRADTARAARWAPPQETRVARSRHRRGVVTTSSSQSRFAPRLSA